MAEPTLRTLSALLREKIPAYAVFTSVNTRIIIRTGVNLKQITSEQEENPALVGRVVEALTRMGIEVSP